ncbi:glycosyltransferase [Rhodococcus globerulus]|uniref:glycosyltransferase n=1 Tax=Rhodococcus globerulus TaxID=33008 RepID=UPI0039E936BB
MTRIALVHDYFAQSGGAERVAIDLASIANDKVHTTFANRDHTFDEINLLTVVESTRILAPVARIDPRLVFPLMTRAVRRIARSLDSDVVLTSSSGWSHRVAASIDLPVVAYMHTPARWLHEPNDYFSSLSTNNRRVAKWCLSSHYSADLRDSFKVKTFIANSTVVQERIHRVYGRDSIVINPPVSIDVAGVKTEVSRLANRPFFLILGRSRGYKNINHALKYFSSRPEMTLAIAGQESSADLPENCIGLGRVTDDELRWLYSKATALIGVSREDFGLTPVEAHMFGTPTLALRAGGYLDSCIDGVNAVFIEELDDESMNKAFNDFDAISWDSDSIIKSASRFDRMSFKEKIVGVLEEAI